MCVCVRKACKSLLTGSQGGSIVGVRKGNPSFLSYSSQKWVLFFSDSDWFDLVCLILLFLFVPGIHHCSSMIHRRVACCSRFIRSFVATVWGMATARWGKKWGSPIWSGLLLPRHHGPAGSSSKSRPGWNAASGRQSIVCSVIVNPMVIRCYQQRCCWFSFLLVICHMCRVCVCVCVFVCVCVCREKTASTQFCCRTSSVSATTPCWETSGPLSFASPLCLVFICLIRSCFG